MTDDLVKRLREVGGMSDDGATRWYINPDGPEAADRIEKLEAALNCNLPDYDLKIGVVERLRQLGNWRVDGTKSSPIYNKSADRIEKLEAALREIIGALNDPKGGQHVYDMRNASYIARKALEDKQ